MEYDMFYIGANDAGFTEISALPAMSVAIKTGLGT
jgi:hypothetical protein